MRQHESKININGEWRTLLIVEAETEQTFGTSLTFAEDNITIIYRVDVPIEHFVETDKHIYWFIPIEKQTIVYESDSGLSDIINTMLGVSENE